MPSQFLSALVAIGAAAAILLTFWPTDADHRARARRRDPRKSVYDPPGRHADLPWVLCSVALFLAFGGVCVLRAHGFLPDTPLPFAPFLVAGGTTP